MVRSGKVPVVHKCQRSDHRERRQGRRCWPWALVEKVELTWRGGQADVDLDDQCRDEGRVG